jgi:hypothetical protein
VGTVGGVQYALAAQTVISTAQNNVTGMSIPLRAGAQYEIVVGMGVQSSNAVGIQAGIQYTVIAGSTLEAQCIGTQAAVGSVGSTRHETFNTLGNAMLTQVTIGVVYFTGIIICSQTSAGTLTITTGAPAGGSGQVRANSYLKVTRIF